MSTLVLPASSRSDKLARMGRKKTTGGQHTTPRKALQVPVTWLNVARRLAAKQKQPTLWFILQKIAEAADAERIERPLLPWEENEADE